MDAASSFKFSTPVNVNHYQFLVDPTLQSETNSQYKSLEAAIQNAKDGDRILLEERSIICSKIVLNKRITIEGKTDKATIFADSLIFQGKDENSGATLQFVTIHCKTDKGITIESGRHVIGPANFSFETPSGNLEIQKKAKARIQGCHFLYNIKDPNQIPKSIKSAIKVDGYAELINNHVPGNDVSEAALHVNGKAVLKGNEFWKTAVGCKVFPGATVIASENKLCFTSTGFWVCNATVTLTKNTFKGTIIGVDVTQDCTLTIVDNTFNGGFGPFVNIPVAQNAPTIQANEFSQGKTIAIRIPSIKGLKSRLEGNNKFVKMNVGTVYTADKHMDAVIAAIQVLLEKNMVRKTAEKRTEK